ncbi:hypothetical protein [Bifidobacterium pseudocatenulatum]|jgi:hypothetical protein|uniref:hypothetical protein n=1 Tax=Bifidobacterium pseudocatenulatum TaxID=28026 RepID=UPI0018A02944|nr:hypothetical protein [Bifidobacterium pseudocatenulatum]
MWGAKAYWQMVFDARYMEGRVNPVLRNSAFFNHRKALFCGVFFSMGKEKIGGFPQQAGSRRLDDGV